MFYTFTRMLLIIIKNKNKISESKKEIQISCVCSTGFANVVHIPLSGGGGGVDGKIVLKNIYIRSILHFEKILKN